MRFGLGLSLSEPVNGSGSGWNVKSGWTPPPPTRRAVRYRGSWSDTQVRHSPIADLGGGNEVEFIGAERFIAVDETVYAIVF